MNITIYGVDITLTKEQISLLIKKPDEKRDITEKVKSVYDAYRIMGVSRVYPSGLSEREIAMRDLEIVVKALNEGWTPDWKDESQYKYFPWFYMDKKGSGFCLAYVDWYFSVSLVPSRLCFKSEKLAEYAATQFRCLYIECML